MLALHDDEQNFSQRYLKLTAKNVIRFYLSDDSHENSILSSLHAARLNASQLRPVISIEMWVQVNRMYNALRDLSQQVTSPKDLGAVLADIRKQCQTFNGITESVLYRDQSWYFRLLGKNLERADQTTRLLDIKYHLLLPSLDQKGSTIDASQWFSLLRAASGYHAFRREFPYVVKPDTVAGFLLLDRRFPRSVAACVETIDYALEKLHSQYHLEHASRIIDINQELSQQLRNDTIERIIAGGLHEYLDRIQLHFNRTSASIAQHFF